MNTSSGTTDVASPAARGARLVSDYALRLRREPAQSARTALFAALAEAGEQDWLACTRALILSSDPAAAEAVATRGLDAHPQSNELRRALAGIHQHCGREAQAQILLREVLAQQPGDAAAAFALARMLTIRGRDSAAAAALRVCFEHGDHATGLAIQAIELLDDCGRKHDAAAIAEVALAGDPHDSHLHAYAGMLQLQLGQFARAREHYLFALEHDAQACEWHVPHSLASAQRYTDGAHADFELFRACLQRSELTDKARSSLLFALGKAHDDIGDHAQATDYFRQANVLAHALTTWSRKYWRRAAESQLASKPLAQTLDAPDWTPIFIVGMPRSGTTLTAQLLARDAQICNRGELPWLATLAQQPILAGNPRREELECTAATYAAHLLQDDSDAHWFIDKQPLNFRYVGLILALWPNARIVHCRRNARDTALSLWSQSFLEDVQGYAFDFADIAVVMRDCERLMAHWRKSHPDSIFDVHYEQLAADPECTMAGLTDWLGMPRVAIANHPTASSVGTASLWQVRQPVFTRSAERWRNYAAYVPELMKFSADY